MNVSPASLPPRRVWASNVSDGRSCFCSESVAVTPWQWVSNTEVRSTELTRPALTVRRLSSMYAISLSRTSTKGGAGVELPAGCWRQLRGSE